MEVFLNRLWHNNNNNGSKAKEYFDGALFANTVIIVKANL